MRNMKSLLVATVITLAYVVSPAESATKTTLFFKDGYAFAEFLSVDGCVETFVFVQALDHASKQDNLKDASSVAEVIASQFDACENTTLLSADILADISDTAFTVSGGTHLTGATLVATLQEFEVNLQWTGTGDTFPSKRRDRFLSPTLKIIQNIDGVERNATAVGTVIFRGTNLTPEPTIDFGARLGRSKLSVLQIIR